MTYTLHNDCGGYGLPVYMSVMILAFLTCITCNNFAKFHNKNKNNNHHKFNKNNKDIKIKPLHYSALFLFWRPDNLSQMIWGDCFC